MKVQNISQSVNAHASLLLRPGTVPGVSMKDPKTQEERQEILDALSPAAKEKLAALGVELPTDLVSVSLNLGSMMFDTLYSHKFPPGAPLRRAIFEKTKQDFALKLSSPEFELTDEEVKSLETILGTDELWDKVQLSVHTGGPDAASKIHYSFGSGIAANFNLVLGACIEAFRGKPLTDKF